MGSLALVCLAHFATHNPQLMRQIVLAYQVHTPPLPLPTHLPVQAKEVLETFRFPLSFPCAKFADLLGRPGDALPTGHHRCEYHRVAL